MAFKGELRKFQVPAVDRMVERGWVLVAYDMGLGKTVLTIAAIEDLLDSEEVREGLVIAPASLKYQWREAIEQFTDGAAALVIDGTPKQRQAQYAKAHHYEYVILNYEQVVNDWNNVRKLGRDFMVLDEATAIKGFRSKRTIRIKRMAADYRFALTGQPLENRPEEVFSIMQWVDPDVLGDPEYFDRTFIVRDNWGKVKRYRNLNRLHELLAEAMVRKRRDDDDVRDELPDVEEESIHPRLDEATAKVYRTVAEELRLIIEMLMVTGNGFDVMGHYGMSPNDDGSNQAEIGRRLMALRMLCDHPQLLVRSAERYQASMGAHGSAYAAELQESGVLDKLPTVSPKQRAVLADIEELATANPKNKIVVFSFFKDMLKILAESCPYDSVQFTGDMNAKQKDNAKRAFQQTPGIRVFFSSDAGGYGVDLPRANYLMSVDLPWSAGALDQRNSRIIRLSSEWEQVTLLNYLIKGSIEVRQYDMLAAKKAIASAVIDGKGIDSKGRLELSLGSLKGFLADSEV